MSPIGISIILERFNFTASGSGVGSLHANKCNLPSLHACVLSETVIPGLEASREQTDLAHVFSEHSLSVMLGRI